MNRSFSFLLLLFFFTSNIYAQEVLTLQEAVSQQKVKASYICLGGAFGKCLRISLRNTARKPLKVMIEPGTQFVSESDHVQDMVVLNEAELVLMTGTLDWVDVQTACTQLYNCSPSSNEFYGLNEAPFPLVKLPQLIAEKDYYNDYYAQGAIWTSLKQTQSSFFENSPIAQALVPILQEVVPVKLLKAEASTGPSFPYTFISTSFPVYLNESVDHPYIEILDSVGDFYTSYPLPELLKPGFYHFKVGVNHRMSPAAKFSMRFMGNEESVYDEKEVLPTDTLMKMQTYSEEFEVFVELDKAYENITAGMYDDEGRLCVLFSKQLKVTQGSNLLKYQWERELPIQAALNFQLRKGEQVLFEKKYNIGGDQREKYPLVVKRGSMMLDLQDDLRGAKLAIDDLKGNRIWVVFQDSFVSRGKRPIQYVFRHDYGKEGKFIAKLYDDKGVLVVSKEI